MSEKPIIFSEEMLRAILDGRKTQTRRVVKDITSPRWSKGDILWVREKYGFLPIPDFDNPKLYYAADENPELKDIKVGWCSPMYMPRKYSRMLLRVVDVRAERLQALTDADAKAEGTPNKVSYSRLWDNLNAKRGYSWESNPYVWVIEFERVTAGGEAE